jgi:hypothetical protein
VPHGGSVVGFYGRDGLAANVGVAPEGTGFSGVVFNYCPFSRDLVRPHLDDLRRARSDETPFSWLSHLIWSTVAILSAVSHLVWSARAILSNCTSPSSLLGARNRG